MQHFPRWFFLWPWIMSRGWWSPACFMPAPRAKTVRCVTLLIVLVACHLDTVMGSNFIRDAVVIAFIANETLSIIENAGLMGVPIPKALTGAIEILKQKSEQDSKEN